MRSYMFDFNIKSYCTFFACTWRIRFNDDQVTFMPFNIDLPVTNGYW